MVDLLNDEEARSWLSVQPRDVAVTIAARAALRALPLISADYLHAAVPACIRGTAVAWTAANFPTRRADLRSAGVAAAEDAADLAARTFQIREDSRYSQDPLGTAAYTARAVANAAATVFAARTSDAAKAARDSVIAAHSAAVAAHNAGIAHGAADDTARANTADTAIIGRSSFLRLSRPKLAIKLAQAPLWSDPVPSWLRQALVRLRHLSAFEEDWEVWLDWYEDRVIGRPANLALEIARATLPDELWKQGPKAVNAEIRRLLGTAIGRNIPDLPDDASLPAQTPRAAIFQPDASGAIGLAPPRPADRLADTDEVRDFYAELREKLDYIVSLGPNMLGSQLDRAARKFQARVPEKPSAAIERLVWSSGNTLRTIVAAHDRVAADRDPHPEKLDPAVAERLRDVVDTFNQLAVADPALRRRDASRPGPQEHERSIGEIKIVVEVATHAAAHRSITNREAGDELLESLAAVRDANLSLPDQLGVELARDTHRNFFAEAIIYVYRSVRNVPGLAQGKGAFISREYFSGIYKEAGKATFLAAGAAGTYYQGWEILNFVLSHSDQLKLYAAYAFEQSPGFKQMIDWLEAQVEVDVRKTR